MSEAPPAEDFDLPPIDELETDGPEPAGPSMLQRIGPVLADGFRQIPPVLGAVSLLTIVAMVMFGTRVEAGLSTLADTARDRQAATATTDDPGGVQPPSQSGETAGDGAPVPVDSVDSETAAQSGDWWVIAGNIGPRPEGAPALPSGDVAGLLDQMEVGEPAVVDDYDRETFPHWRDIDGDGGCADARQTVLRRDVFDEVDAEGDGCAFSGGTLYGGWSGQQFLDASAAEVDIDHVAPLGWAWDRGAAAWDNDRRQLFANDPANLISTVPEVNRSRGAAVAPPEWEPPSPFGRCVYLFRFAAVVNAYELTVTQAEKDALADLASSGDGCIVG